MPIKTNTNYYPTAFFRDDFRAFNNCAVSIASNSLQYSIITSETLRGYTNTINDDPVAILFRIDEYVDRFVHNAHILQITLQASKMRSIVEDLIIDNKPTGAFAVRMNAYAAEATETPVPWARDKQVMFYMYEATPLLEIEPIICCFSSYTRSPALNAQETWNMGGVSLTNQLAQREALNTGFDEPLLMDTDGNVVGLPYHNIFVVKRSEIYTTVATHSVHDGITRASVVELARNKNYIVHERSLSRSDILMADELFAVGRGAIIPISVIDQHVLSETTPITDDLRESLNVIVSSTEHEYITWVNALAI